MLMMPVRLPFFLYALFTATSSLTAQFGPQQAIPLDHPEGPLHLLDMDGDGHSDLIGLFDWNEFKWARNVNGTGMFLPPAGIATIYSAPHLYAVVDLQLDGLPDIVYVNQDFTVRTIRNLGNGNFGPPQNVGQLPGEPGAMACKDITGDGLPELILSLPLGLSGSGFGWFPNTGTGFLSLVPVEDVVNGPTSTILLLGDMDGIGGIDVVLRDGDGTMIVQRNMNADGSDWNAAIALAFPSFPYGTPELMDLDADGDLDIVATDGTVAHWAENRVSEGGEWLPFTDHLLGASDDIGSGYFALMGCGAGVSFVYAPVDGSLPMRWRTYLPQLGDLSYAGDLVDLERGAVLLIGDLDGDGRNDLIMEREEGLSWHRNLTTDPTTVLDMPTLDPLCIFGPPVVLPEMVPSGGRWTGNWVIDGVLHRANIGLAGALPVAHTVYEPQGCPVAGVSLVQLLNGPTVSPDLSAPVCTGNGPITLTAEPANVTWTGVGQDGILDPATFTGGAVVCSWTDNTGMQCASILGPVLIWNSVPVAIAPAGPFCVTDALQAVSASILPPQGGSWSGDIAGTVSNVALFDPGMGAGSYVINLHVDPTGPQQCANDASITVVVSDVIPEVTIEPFESYCANGSAITLSGAWPLGGTWSGSAIQGGVMEPLLLGPGQHVIEYSYEDPAGCAATAQTTIDLFDAVQLNWSSEDLTVCPTDGPVHFTALPSGGSWSAPIGPNGILEPSGLTEGDHPVAYIWNGPNGCTLTHDSGIITVPGITEVVLSDVPPLCDDGAPVEISANLAGTWSGTVTGEGASILFDPEQIGAGLWTVSLDATEPGSCPGAASMQVLVEVCTGMAEPDLLAALRLAPNPFQSDIGLYLELNGTVQVEVLDAAGRVVLARNRLCAGRGIMDLELGEQPNGPYIVRVRHERSVVHLRAIKAD